MSGSTIGGLAGAGIGFIVGGPAGAKLGAWIGSTAGGLIAPGTINGPKLGDAQVQTSMAGAPRPIVFGHPAPFAGNLIDGEKKARKRTRKTKQGKGGGPSTKEEYFLLTSAIRVCEGPIAGFVRIWEDGAVVYDARTTFPPGWEGYSKEIRIKQAKWLSKARLYLGDEDQLPDPSLEAIHGGGNTPYYRGTAYIVVKDAESQDGTAKRYMFEVASAGTAVTVNDDAILDLGPSMYFPLQSDYEDKTGNRSDLVPSGTYGFGGVGFETPTGAGGAGAIADSGVGGSSEYTILIHCNSTNMAPGYHVLAKHETNSILGYCSWFIAHTGTQTFILVDNLGGAGLFVYGPTLNPLGETFTMGIRQRAGFVDLLFNGATYASAAHGHGSFHNSGNLQVLATLTGSGGRLVGFTRALTDAEVRDVTSYMTGGGSSVPAIPDSAGGFLNLLFNWIVFRDLSHDTFTADAGVSLAYVEEQVCLRCNIPIGKLDFSDLAGITIPGFLVTDQPTGADTLLPLMQANFHDLPEVDGLLLARLRGGASVMSFTDDDLIDTGEDEEVVRPQEIEFPLKVSVVTQDPDADYGPIPQISLRYSPSVRAANEVTLQVPIPYRAAEAAKIAHKLHKIAWSNAEANIERVLPQEFCLLAPSDPVTYDNRRWLVIEREYTDGEVRIKAVYERASDVNSAATGQPVPAPTPPGGTVLGPTVFMAMNLPSMRPEDNVPGVYLAAMWPMSATAADIYLSTDGGLTESLALTMTQPTKMGELVDDEPSGGEPITVHLYGDGETLDNVTTAQVEAGQNIAAIVDASNNAELIGFEDATETSSGDWELSTLTRGLLGTTEASHLTGERFVSVDYLYFLPIPAEFAGQTLIFRAVTQGTTVDANPTFSLVFDPPTFAIDGGGP